jgi:hypothetical protein
MRENWERSGDKYVYLTGQLTMPRAMPRLWDDLHGFTLTLRSTFIQAPAVS